MAEKRRNRETGQRKKDTGKSIDQRQDRHPTERKREEKNLEQKKNPEQKNQAEKKNLCPYQKKCGGCQLLHMPYEKQLAWKQNREKELLGEFGKIAPIIGMKEPWHYRNKAHAVYGYTRQHKIVSGFYQEGTHKIVPVDACMIQDPVADRIMVTVRELLRSFKIKTYDEDTGYGLFRHVLVRTGFSSGEVMVVLVTGSPVFPSRNNFVKALRAAHPEITTIVHNINDKQTSMILGEREHVLYGKGYIEDTLCGKIFRISSKSFYQVNPRQTEILYRKALEFADFSGDETLLDAYCGIGTIGLIASDRVKNVIGVESNSAAVKDAVLNAKRNQVKNIQFYCKDAGEFLVNMASAGEKVDAVIMDPPREGSSREFLDSLAFMAPQKVVYVSCNPETLARDLKVLVRKGYQVKKMVPVDMFAQCEHVETVVLLSQQKPDDTIEIDLDLDELDATSAELKATYQEIKDYVLKE
ncbi:MAG: 23S rRNA (uracil(1939)-C(5))-methyltransferase RlmD, partial [Robinsoniella sp.]|nr:23S rRNA (uracil(1939)-C(5))-methyltransferase RlmD [Robinsoniella sp.]